MWRNDRFWSMTQASKPQRAFFQAVQWAIYLSVHPSTSAMSFSVPKYIILDTKQGYELLSVHPYCWLAKHLWQALKVLRSWPALMVIQLACTCQELHSFHYLSLRGREGRFRSEKVHTLCVLKSTLLAILNSLKCCCGTLLLMLYSEWNQVFTTEVAVCYICCHFLTGNGSV